jgi:hypothetical protein
MVLQICEWLTGMVCQNWTAHPWINDDKVAPDRPLDSAVLSRLKHFSAMNKLKKMALRVLMIPFSICFLRLFCCFFTASS